MIVVLTLAGCGPPDAPPEDEQAMSTIQEVKEARAEGWMALPGVTGVGIGLCDGEECLRVFLARPSPEAEDAIPERVEGYRVELEVTGSVRPRTSPDASS